MGLGNGNPKSGDKGSNHNHQHRQLLAIGELITAVVSGTTGLATEATLLQILNNIIASQDVEILLVRDKGNADKVVQQIREYDQGTGAWTTRYEDVDGAAYVPVGPLEYLDPSAVLNLILTELLDQGVTLDAIQVEQLAQGLSLDSIVTNTTGLATQLTLNDLLTAFNAEDFATETTLANLNTKLNTLGQKASAGSLPAVLSTEQEVILNDIKTAVQNIDSDLGTGGLALETTQVAIQNLITSTNALLTTIDADTSNLDVLLSTRAADASVLATNALLTTIDGVLDAIKIDTGALVVDVAAIEVLITTTNSLLTTIDGVLDAIKLDTANLDVALSTVATEVTLNSLLTAFNNEDFASQTTLAAILACLCTDENSVRNLLQSIDADTGNIATSTANIDTTLTPATRTHNTVTATVAGSVPAGSLSGSVLNAGNQPAGWNGAVLPAGVSIPWAPIGNRDTYGAISYDPTLFGSTTLIIEYTT
jgi:hypothetical protein